jgi:hypothetical protein
MAEKPPGVVLTRPTFVDYAFLLAGFALSQALMRASLFQVEPAPGLPEAARGLVALSPQLLRMTEGVVLMWPVFFGVQRLLGRTQGLTAVEWLWVIAWVGTAAVSGLAAWNRWSPLPPAPEAAVRWAVLLWYAVLVPSVAALALAAGALGVFWRAQPWTSQFGVALLAWPALPLAGIWALGKVAF